MITSSPSRAAQPVRLTGEDRERIGVEHERHAAALDQAEDEARTPSPVPRPGPDGDDVGGGVEDRLERALGVERPVASSGSGSVMYSGAIDGEDRHDRRRRRRR